MTTANDKVLFGGIALNVPQDWKVSTEMYDDNDIDRASIAIEAPEGPASVILSFGDMPEGSDAMIEATETYEDLMEEEADELDAYNFKGWEGWGFDYAAVEGEDEDEVEVVSTFMCVNVDGRLLTLHITAADDDQLEDLLDYLEENLDIE